MNNKFKVWVEPAGIIEIMQSNEMQDILSDYANRAVAKLGDGYEAESYMGKDRAKVKIKATTYKAYKENLEENTILKAVMK